MRTGCPWWATTEVYDGASAFWRFIVILVVAGVLGGIWALLRRRWAPRTVDSWSGAGVCPELTALQAGLLLQAHPSLLVAVALEPLLAEGRARLLSAVPLSLGWDDRPGGETPMAVLGRAVREDGTVGLEGLWRFLEALQSETNELLEPYSGRESAVHYRRRVKKAWARALKGAEPTGEDRPWLLLVDPPAVIHRIPATPVGERLHDLVRLAGVFRASLVTDRELADRAHGATSGYFRHRGDLDLVRTKRGVRVERDRPETAPRSPIQAKLDAISKSLDGAIVTEEPPLPLLLYYSEIEPKVVGRHRGRVASVTLGNDGLVTIDLTCSAACAFRLAARGGDASEPPPGALPVKSGDDAFDAAYLATQDEPDAFEEWMTFPRIRPLIEAHGPFLEMIGLPTRLVLRFPYDRDRFTAKEVLNRFDPLLTFAEWIEERRVASGARGPSGGSV